MLKMFLDYVRLRRNLRLSHEEIKRLQWRKLKYILAYAYNNAPFYREKFDKAGIKPEDIRSFSDIRKIPVTTKEELRKSGLKILARGYNLRNCKPSRTSGSTGMPFVCYFDNNTWNLLKYCSKFRFRKICGLKLRDKIINIEVHPQKAVEAARYRWLTEILFRIKRISVFEDISEHIKFYKKFKPDVLYGFPSYFIQLGDYMKKNKIKIKLPRLIFISSEMLDVNTKKLLKEYYGNIVFNIYGSTELKEVAWECKKHEGYHVNEDLYFVELADIKGNKNSPEEKEIIITSLENKAMPLIRYAIGDRGEEIKRSCSCGIPFSLIKPTQGRYADCFIMPDGRIISPYAATMALEPIKGILQYQIIQHKKNSFEVKFRPMNPNDKEIAKRIKEEMMKKFGKKILIKVVRCSEIPREKNGKYRVVKSEVER